MDSVSQTKINGLVVILVFAATAGTDDKCPSRQSRSHAGVAAPLLYRLSCEYAVTASFTSFQTCSTLSVLPQFRRRQWLASQSCHGDAGPQVPRNTGFTLFELITEELVYRHFGYTRVEADKNSL